MTVEAPGTGYRMVVRAYPRGRRRGEMLDTLMEAAQHRGRVRPSVGETLDLLRHGMRYRLGRPGGPAVVITAVLLALVAGFVTAACGARLGWELGPGFPRGAALNQLGQSLYPGSSVADDGGYGAFEDDRRTSAMDVLRHGHDEDYGYRTISVRPVERFLTGDPVEWATQAATRLSATGWEVSAVERTQDTDVSGAQVDDGAEFLATRGELVMNVGASLDGYDTPAGAFVPAADISRTTPWQATVLTVLGWLVGGLSSWLVTGWASRRTERASTVVRSLTREPVIIALLLLVPQAVYALFWSGTELYGVADSGGPFWTMSVTYFYGFAVTGVLLLIFSLIVAAVAGRPETDPIDDRTLPHDRFAR